jgi:DNA (cytosine-5)-methyltransferase 1
MKNSSYLLEIAEVLTSVPNGAPLVIDLFAGCGGLALGFEAQGFKTVAFEKDADCCATYKKNLHGECHNVELTLEFNYPIAPVVIGGPPCQPFSVRGRQDGLRDGRDGFPIFIRAVQQVQPDIFVFENVRGLMYKNKWYLEEIIQALRELGYIVEYQLINMAKYGVPQRRERVFVVGHRGAKICEISETAMHHFIKTRQLEEK